MSVFLQNVVLTLRCSTFSSLMTSEAFERLGRPLWLNATAPVVNFVVLVISLVTLRAAFRWDAAGAPEAEQVFFREGEKVKEGRVGLSLCLLYVLVFLRFLKRIVVNGTSSPKTVVNRKSPSKAIDSIPRNPTDMLSGQPARA